MLLQAVAISLEDEGAIVSFSEKSGTGGNTPRCTICNRLGHMASKCVSKDRFHPANAQAVMSFMSSFKCGRAGQLAREIVDRSRTREHADQGVTRKSVVRVRQLPVSKGAPWKLHAVSKKRSGYVRETNVRS